MVTAKQLNDDFDELSRTALAVRDERDRLRKVNGDLVRALESALERLPHPTACFVINPTEDWWQKGSWSIDTCTCGIAEMQEALKNSKEAI